MGRSDEIALEWRRLHAWRFGLVFAVTVTGCGRLVVECSQGGAGEWAVGLFSVPICDLVAKSWPRKRASATGKTLTHREETACAYRARPCGT